jgi:hypothetical protein
MFSKERLSGGPRVVFVRFVLRPPEGERRLVMSALPPKADMCGAPSNVRFGPEADIPISHSITSSAATSTDGGIVRPSALAVPKLTVSSTFVDCCTGKSAGFSPLRMRPV